MANYRQINFLEFPEEIGNTMLLCVIDDSKSRYELLGRYNGYYTITFLDGTGTLIAPIRDELYINVLEN